jgi:hypothetical protein
LRLTFRGYTPLAKPLRTINFPRLSQWSECVSQQ